MREILILALVAAAGYLAYDDYYKQRPALEQARASIQQLTAERDQLRQNPARPMYAPTGHPAPTWFEKHLDESSSSLDTARRHRQKEEEATPRP
jgi:hypothetical protein